MYATMTLQLSEDLAARLQPLTDQIPRILELGLRKLTPTMGADFDAATEVYEFLAALPSPEEVVALRPSEHLQARISALLEKNRTEGLTPPEEHEWQQYAQAERLVRLAKAKAHLKLKMNRVEK